VGCEDSAWGILGVARGAEVLNSRE
jgi:hypothetical protein